MIKKRERDLKTAHRNLILNEGLNKSIKLFKGVFKLMK